MNFSDKIKICRKENKMTQEQFAQKFNVSRKTVSGWENGRSFPDIKTLVTISNTFNISLDDLLKEDNIIKYYQSEISYNRKNKKVNVILYFLLWISFALLYIQFLSTFKLPYHVVIISLLFCLIMYVVFYPNYHRISSFKRAFEVFLFFIFVFVINIVLFVVSGNLEINNDPYWSMGIIVGALFIDFILSLTLCVLVFFVPKILISIFQLLRK